MLPTGGRDARRRRPGPRRRRRRHRRRGRPWPVGVDTSEGTITLELSDGALGPSSGCDRRRWGGPEANGTISSIRPPVALPTGSSCAQLSQRRRRFEAEVLAKALFLAGSTRAAAAEADELGIPAVLVSGGAHGSRGRRKSKSDSTFWLLARASGLVAYALLAASVVLGLVVKARPLGRSVSPAAVADLHCFRPARARRARAPRRRARR